MAKFYYVKREKLEDVEFYDNYYQCMRRHWLFCEYKDIYKKGRYNTSQQVPVMVLIPTSKFNSTKYMYYNKYDFSVIDLKSNEIFKYRGEYYIKEFEERLNTYIWQEYCKENG